jgi:hypothetical protein
LTGHFVDVASSVAPGGSLTARSVCPACPTNEGGSGAKSGSEAAAGVAVRSMLPTSRLGGSRIMSPPSASVVICSPKHEANVGTPDGINCSRTYATIRPIQGCGSRLE